MRHGFAKVQLTLDITAEITKLTACSTVDNQSSREVHGVRAIATGGYSRLPDRPRRWRRCLRFQVTAPITSNRRNRRVLRPCTCTSVARRRRQLRRCRSPTAGSACSGIRRGGRRCRPGSRPRSAGPDASSCVQLGQRRVLAVMATQAGGPPSAAGRRPDGGERTLRVVAAYRAVSGPQRLRDRSRVARRGVHVERGHCLRGISRRPRREVMAAMLALGVHGRSSSSLGRGRAWPRPVAPTA